MVSTGESGVSSSKCSGRTVRSLRVTAFMAAQLFICPHRSLSFQSQPAPFRMPMSRVYAAEGMDDDITRQLERARDLLAKSRAKMEAKDIEYEEDLLKDENAANAKKTVPFFATQDIAQESSSKKEKVIKSTNDQGLFTTDGAMMAKMSETEQWEVRSLLEVFESESGNKDGKTKSIADRDVAASIFNLRRKLQTEDFMRIFDKRNRFIGEP